MLKLQRPPEPEASPAASAPDPDRNEQEGSFLSRSIFKAVLAGILIVVVLLASPSGESTTVIRPPTLAREVAPSRVLTIVPGREQVTTTTVVSDEAVEEEEPAVAPIDPDPFFISPGAGNNDNDGRSLGSPWKSLLYALDRVEPGQTLYLMDGEYDEAENDGFHYLVTRGGTETDWVRITAAPGHQPVLVANTGTALEVRANYVEVDGLTVQGRGFSESNSWGVGLSVRGSHHVYFINNRVSGMPVSGISGIESSNLLFGWNEVYENSYWSNVQGSGISIWHSVDWAQGPDEDGYHDKIIGNVIYRNENKIKSKWNNFKTITDGNGIIIDENDYADYSGRTLVANNIIFDNGGRAVHIFKANHVDVIHNTTYHNGRTPGLDSNPTELSASRANDVRFINNLAWARSSLPPLVSNRSSEVISSGNLLVGDTTSDAASNTDRSVSQAPELVAPSTDPSVADFRPQFDVGRLGQPVQLRPRITLDADDNPRPLNGADVGAYQGQDEPDSGPRNNPTG